MEFGTDRRSSGYCLGARYLVVHGPHLVIKYFIVMLLKNSMTTQRILCLMRRSLKINRMVQGIWDIFTTPDLAGLQYGSVHDDNPNWPGTQPA